jgi:hypothetical protein
MLIPPRLLLLPLLALAASVPPDLILRGRVSGPTAPGAAPAPLAFANVGIRGRNVGTTADEAGRFRLRVPAALGADSVTFSALGYAPRTVAVTALAARPDTVLVLTTRPQELADVSVKASGQARTFELGKTRAGASGGFVVSKGAGAELARLLVPPHYPAFVDQVRVYITANSAPSFRLRLRLYARDPATGRPGADLLQQSILLESSLRSGWLTADLRPYNVLVQEPFFVAYEWLEANSLNPVIGLQGQHGDRAVFQRSVSQGAWVPSADFNWVINAQVTAYGAAK